MSDLIAGIDLGTTNSEIAVFVDGQVRVIGPGDTRMLPSCVGFSTSGELLVGEAARNQQALYPERTVRSIKRKMGGQETVTLHGKEFTPQEVSALILRELAEWAHGSLGERPQKAVITVPAYFSDAQRNATREAGALAGLEVVRILNEPTAASLAYGYGDGSRHTVLIYDLGGGTFDVSVVTVEGDITEVLASHGNNHLGGDDFDDLLAERLAAEFEKQNGIDVRQGYPAAKARLWWAAEEAKKKLSFEPYAKIREEALGAGVMASRLAGRAVERVLVDVSPYSFGVSYLGDRGGFPYPHCYKPIIRRNTPLPLTRTERYMTSHPYQTEVDVQVYQGDDEDALKNILVGDFRVEGLTSMEDANEILCRMRLDLDGILEVAAVEKLTGKSKHIRIANALRAKSAEEIAAGRKRIQELYETRGEMVGDAWETAEDLEEEVVDGGAQVVEMPAPVRADGDAEIESLLERSHWLLAKMHAEDREEAIDLHEKIDTAAASGDVAALKEASGALKELLFFVEGQN